jgi:3-keto-disaccharide hydrolase
MRANRLYGILCMLLVSPTMADDSQWQSLFNGNSLDGWDAADLGECFQVKDGAIVAGGGPLARLSYVGPVNHHDFKNFELRIEVMTRPGSNGGIFFHTGPQKEFLKKGYEAQVCNSCGDSRKTGSLLVVEDHDTSPVKDDEWFEYHVLVSGKRIILKVNGTTTVDYTEPPYPKRPETWEQRVLSHGLIALQAHDANSTVIYRNIRIKVLPD